MNIPSNRVRDIERYFYDVLASLYPEGEIRQFVRMLFEAYLGWNTAQLLLHRDDTVNQSDLLRFHWAAKDLKKHRPIQHIIGYADFCGCRLSVNEHTLIPRPETEEIVGSVISASTTPPSRILDVCTGSGCIAIALSKAFPEAEVLALDISSEALQVAQNNAKRNAANVVFQQCDVLHGLSSVGGKWDLIISNPPYIRQSEQEAMQPNVLNYEPHLALFVPDSDPLRFYRVIAQYAETHLVPGGQLAFEINEFMADETLSLLHTFGFAAQLHSDFRGKPRSIVSSLVG